MESRLASEACLHEALDSVGDSEAESEPLGDSDDDTDTDVLAGNASISLSLVTGGASVGLTFISKKTDAFLAQTSQVTARGNSVATLNVFDDVVNPTGFVAKTIHGLAVQAVTSENLVTFPASGQISMSIGLMGSLAGTIVDSDTTAYIDGLVNQDLTGANEIGRAHV